jgi:glycine/D-amino acid oxidase-like deaminating enzyme
MVDRNLPEVWDDEADLVVVGSGGGGLTGAVVAAAEGASVIVMEKARGGRGDHVGIWRRLLDCRQPSGSDQGAVGAVPAWAAIWEGLSRAPGCPGPTGVISQATDRP